jgi:IclR family transcriptional regulator, acetate operon repressor
VTTPGEGKNGYSVRVVDRVCLILNLLQESAEGVTLNEMVQATGLPKASTFRYLRTLEYQRYVERVSPGTVFRLGPGFVGMQSRHLEILRERARPVLESLREEFEETANLGVLDGDRVIYVDVVESRRGVRLSAARGVRVPLHCTALGKAIASRLPDDRIRDLHTSSGLLKLTPDTIETLPTLFQELARIRHSGYAIDDREYEEDGRCIAVPLLGTHIPAALSISGPSSRFSLDTATAAAQTLITAATSITTTPIPAGPSGNDPTPPP